MQTSSFGNKTESKMRERSCVVLVDFRDMKECQLLLGHFLFQADFPLENNFLLRSHSLTVPGSLQGSPDSEAHCALGLTEASTLCRPARHSSDLT